MVMVCGRMAAVIVERRLQIPLWNSNIVSLSPRVARVNTKCVCPLVEVIKGEQ